MQNWDDLKFFLAVAREGSLAGAARSLHVNHSTVFRRLNALEDAVGVRLFERLPHGYALTEAGAEMFASADQIQEAIDGLERQLVGRDYRLVGTIRLTTTDTLGAHFLHRHLREFRAHHPGITLELVTGDTLFDLTRREADVALRPTDDPPPHLVGRNLARVAWAVYGAPGYLAERGPVRTASDLTAHAMIGSDDNLSGLTAARWLRAQLPETAIVYRASSFLMQLAAAEAGMGLVLLPCVLAEPAPGVRRVFGPIKELTTGLWILSHADLRHAARIRAFVKFMTDAIRNDQALLDGRPAS